MAVHVDAFTREVNAAFDGVLGAPPSFEGRGGLLVALDELREQQRLAESVGSSSRHLMTILVVGANGTGKTTLLEALRTRWSLPAAQRFDFARDRAVVSHPLFGSPEQAVAALSACGLGSVKSWLQPFHLLSGGQQARVLLALKLQQGDGAVLDNLGAAVERQCARVLAAAAGRVVRKGQLKRVLFATTNCELCRWLQPDVCVVLTPGAEPGAAVSWQIVQNRNPFVPGGRDADCRRPTVLVRVDPSDVNFSRPTLSAVTDRNAMEDFPKPPWLRTIDAEQFLKGACILTSTVQQDEANEHASRACEIEFSGTVTNKLSPCPLDALRPLLAASTPKIVMLYGQSGSGKSTHLGRIAAACGTSTAAFTWGPTLAVVSQMGTPYPAWALRRLDVACFPAGGARLLPFHLLSSSEQELAIIARALAPGDYEGDFVCIDELTSTLDDSTAHAMCVSVAAYVRASERLKLVFASVHKKPLEQFSPDVMYEISSSPPPRLAVFGGDPMPPPPPVTQATYVELFEHVYISGTLKKCSHTLWDSIFSEWHYLSSNLQRNSYSDCYALRLDADPLQNPIAFVCFCNGDYGRQASDDKRVRKREHRLVVLPGWQGLGLGPRVSEAACFHIATRNPKETVRVLAVTAHKTLGMQRTRSPLWTCREEGWSREDQGTSKANTTFVSRYLYHHELNNAEVGRRHRERHAVPAAPPPVGPDTGAEAAASSADDMR